MKRDHAIQLIATVLLATAAIVPGMPIAMAQNTAQPSSPQQQAQAEAAQQYSQAYQLHIDRRWPEALPFAERALVAAKAGFGDVSIGAANANNLMSDVLQGLDRMDEARPYVERMLAIRREVFGEVHMQTGDAWYSVGRLHEKSHNFAEAKRSYQKSQEVCAAAEGPKSQSAIKAIWGLGNIAKQEGDYRGALVRYGEVQQLIESAPNLDNTFAAWFQKSLGEIHYELKDYSKAREHFERAYRTLRDVYGERSVNVAVLYGQLGMTYVDQEDPAAGRKYFESELAIYEQIEGPNSQNAGVAHQHLGILFSNLGEHRKAQSHFEKSLQIHESRPNAASDPGTAKVYNSLGIVFMDLREHELAVTYLEKALAVNRKVYGDNHPQTAMYVLNLASQRYNMKDYAVAKELSEQALAIYRTSFGETHLATAGAHNNLAAALDALDDRSEGLVHARQATDIHRQLLGPQHPTTASSISNLGVALEANGRTAEAIACFDESRRVFREYIGRLLPNLSEHEQLSFLKSNDYPRLQVGLLVGWMHRDESIAATRSAEWLLNGKAVAQESAAGRVLLARDSRRPELAQVTKNLSQVREQLASKAFATPAAGGEQSHREQLSQLDAAEQDLVRKAAALGLAAPTSPWFEVADVRKKLPPGTVLIDIARFKNFNLHGKLGERDWLPERYAAWLIPPAGLGEVTIIDLGEVDAIHTAIRNLREAVEAPGAIQESGEQQAEKLATTALSALSKTVLEPVLAKLPAGTNRLYLSPDSDLWLVPWSALPLADGCYAIEQYEIQYFVSSRDVLAQNSNGPATAKPIIMADPNFDLSPADSLAATQAVLRGQLKPDNQLAVRSAGSGGSIPKVLRLPGTAAEAAAVAPKLAAYAGSEPITYTDRYALEGIFKALVRPKALVMSTHGFFLEGPDTNVAEPALGMQSRGSTGISGAAENPLVRCGLLLAGCNTRDKARTSDDGILTGLEIVGTDLRGTQLVVLSACQTGLGDISSGEGVSGLRQAFQLAGAKAVVATLWQIPDRDTALLMTDFFDALSSGETKSAALRKAQLSRIAARRERGGAAHPFFWAAFTITGQ